MILFSDPLLYFLSKGKFVSKVMIALEIGTKQETSLSKSAIIEDNNFRIFPCECNKYASTCTCALTLQFNVLNHIFGR